MRPGTPSEQSSPQQPLPEQHLTTPIENLVRFAGPVLIKLGFYSTPPATSEQVQEYMIGLSNPVLTAQEWDQLASLILALMWELERG